MKIDTDWMADPDLSKPLPETLKQARAVSRYNGTSWVLTHKTNSSEILTVRSKRSSRHRACTYQIAILQIGASALPISILAFYSSDLYTEVRSSHRPYYFPHPHTGNAASLTIQCNHRLTWRESTKHCKDAWNSNLTANRLSKLIPSVAPGYISGQP